MTEHLNADTLDELKDVMEADFPVLLETYVSDSELQFKRLRNAWQDGELDGLRRGAHSLKGSSGNIGAEQLAALCARLEAMARSGETAEVPETIISVAEELSVVQAAIRDIHQSCQR